MPVVSLAEWGDIGQIIIAGTGLVAVLGAPVQIRIARANARRARLYEYADSLNTKESLALWHKWSVYWKSHTYAQFKAEQFYERGEWYALANLMEEIGTLYDRNLIDRSLAAEYIGQYAENLWTVSDPFVQGAREDREDPWVYDYWDQMQRQTPRQRRRAQRRIQRRREWRSLFI